MIRQITIGIAIVLLAINFGACVGEKTEKKGDFRNSKWGMTIAEVEESEEALFDFKWLEMGSYEAGQEIFGFSANWIDYFFNSSGELYLAVCGISSQENNDNNDLSIYDELKETMIMLYGAPVIDTNNGVWEEDIFRYVSVNNMLNSLIGYTKTNQVYTQWKTERSEIALCGFENHVTIAYYSLFTPGVWMPNQVFGWGYQKNTGSSDSMDGSSVTTLPDSENIQEFVQDLSKWPMLEDWMPMYPEYEDLIRWDSIPKDYIGGLGAYPLTKEDLGREANVRKTPSVSAEIIGTVQYEFDREYIDWWVTYEFYINEDQLFRGSYVIEADKYQWIPVRTVKFNSETDEYESERGWVAIEEIILGTI